MTRHNGTGTLQYYTNWAVLYIDPGLVRYYRSLIPVYFGAKPQMHPAHITVVRKDIETAKNWEAWGKYPDRQLGFSYEPVVRHDETYFWLCAWSDDIGDIREELGLPRMREGFENYHITLANIKA